MSTRELPLDSGGRLDALFLCRHSPAGAIRICPLLAEIAFWCLTPSTFDARRLGYLNAAISLWARGSRCRRDWRDHEMRAKAAMIAASETLTQRRTCVVLGSGLLRDVPLDDLSAQFERVVLVDIVHLWPARLKALFKRNVEFLDLDLTGTTDMLLNRAPGFADPLIRLAQDTSIDLVISATCLSQLPLGPEAIVARRKRPFGRVPKDLGRQIIDRHLDGLMRLPGRVCLVTDTEVVTRDRSGHVIDREDLLEGALLPKPDDQWDWVVAPFGEYARDEELVHRVQAYTDFRVARRRG